MAAKKGAALEEIARAYFQRQGYFALRSVPYRFEGEEVTDIDVWIYGRQAASGRIRAIVDAKDKRSPKALERVLWTKGLQTTTGSDRAIVVTTDNSPRVNRFARENRVSIVTKAFLDEFAKSDRGRSDRLTLEGFYDHVNANKAQKQDGDWLSQIENVKTSLVTNPGFPAFNTATSAFRFFGEKIETRPLYREQAIRCCYLTAAVACASLDSALERIVFDDAATKIRAINSGIVFGDTGDGRTQKNLQNVLHLVAASMENGRALSAQIESSIDSEFKKIRADIISEYFSKDSHQFSLFSVARELEERAHTSLGGDLNGLSIEAKGTLGVFADFCNVKRSLLFKNSHADHNQTTPLRLKLI
ncbi:restriction endonuclease [uncultured Brevundimonas sp.]|uniref:restriction endonuclease n=1 Tax=uncultured Brevundimonas sp. TaxID=213418 RepID=UPI0025E4BFEC|nr:restriction endonuclease [uncultured Brevundimonas sp.]